MNVRPELYPNLFQRPVTCTNHIAINHSVNYNYNTLVNHTLLRSAVLLLPHRCLHGTALPYLASELRRWQTSIQERGCDLHRRLPLSHHLRVVRRLVTMRSSSLHRVPGTLCHPASLCLRQSAPSSVVWKCIFLPRHSLNFSKLRTSDFVLYFDSEKCSWSNL